MMQLVFERTLHSMRLILILIIISACSVELKEEVSESTTTVTLSNCEIIEIKYVDYSNNLLSSARDFSLYIDNISPNSIDLDREKFFNEIDINYKYKERYISYLETRLMIIKNIHDLLTLNLDCNFSDDQSISLEQVIKAQDELDIFLNK